MRRLPLAVLVVGALVVPACGNDAATTTSSGSTGAGPATAAATSRPDPGSTSGPSETSSPADAPAEVPEALDFRSPTVSDGDLDLATFAGRPVAFWFWAPG